MTLLLRSLIAIALLMLALPSAAQAQSGCNGQLPAGWVCGNYGGSQGFPGAAPLSNYPATTQAFTDTSTTKIATDAFVKAQVQSLVCNAVTDGGAKEDGSTNDYTAWTFCNSALQTAGGGYLYFPPSTEPSCNKTATLTPNAGVVVLGAGNGYGDSDNPTDTSSSKVSNCGVDITIFNFNAANVGMYHMDVEGMGFGATQPTVTAGSGATRSLFYDNNINGGAPPLKISCVDCVFMVNRVTHAYGGTTTANVLVQNGGFHGIRNIFNTHWVCLPTAAFFTTDIAPWSATTWPACSVVSATGPDGGTYYIQTVEGGTSTGSSVGTLLPYGNNITDGGGVVWQLLRPQGVNIVGGTVTHNFFDLQCDTGCNGVDEYSTDHSGAAIGIGMTNTLSGAAPSNLYEANDSFGNNLGDGIAAQYGTQISVFGGNANTCATTNCAAIDALASWTSGINVSNFKVWLNVTGMRIRGGTNFTLNGSTIVGSSSSAVTAAANVNDVVITGNFLGSDPNYGPNVIGVTLQAGTGDYITVQSNDFNGATTAMSNSATGSHNNLCPNVGLCSVRTRLAAATTYYINASTGVDNNLCTSAAPCLTGQATMNLVSNTIDNAGNAVTIQFADGSYSAGVVCNGPFTGSGLVTLKGNTTTWTNVVLNSGGTGIAAQVMNNCVLNITGMQLKGSGDLIQVVNNGQVTYSDIDFTATSGGAHVAVRVEGFAQQAGPINISGLTGNHALFNNNGVYQEQGQTTTFGGAFTFTAYLAGNFASSAKVTNNTYTLNGHSQTGDYFILTQGSQLFTNGQYCTSGLPGNALVTPTTSATCQ